MMEDFPENLLISIKGKVSDRESAVFIKLTAQVLCLYTVWQA
jgi:hypothetical protein